MLRLHQTNTDVETSVNGGQSDSGTGEKDKGEDGDRGGCVELYRYRADRGVLQG